MDRSNLSRFSTTPGPFEQPETGRQFDYANYQSFAPGRNAPRRLVGQKRPAREQKHFYGKFRCSVLLPTD